MNKNLKKGLIVIVVLIVIGYFTFPIIKDYLVNNLGKRDVQSEEAAYTLKTKDIVAEFTANEATANEKYLNKPVAISGVVTSVNDKEVIIDEIGICNFITADATLKAGQTVTVKGRVVGYDDLMGGVNLDQCSINK
jgi:tRNA_anti-like